MIQFLNSGGFAFGATAVVTIPPFEDIPLFSGGRFLLHDFQGFGSHVAGLNLITRTSTTVGLPTATWNTLELNASGGEYTNPIILRVWERMK